MAQWDFSASVEELVALSGEGRGPTSMSAMLSAAHEVVARLRARDPLALQQWLDANAEPLIAQQMLARSVHAQQGSNDEMRCASWRVARWPDGYSHRRIDRCCVASRRAPGTTSSVAAKPGRSARGVRDRAARN